MDTLDSLQLLKKWYQTQKLKWPSIILKFNSQFHSIAPNVVSPIAKFKIRMTKRLDFEIFKLITWENKTDGEWGSLREFGMRK